MNSKSWTVRHFNIRPRCENRASTSSNSKAWFCRCGSPQRTANSSAFESVIAHEYFHKGRNRITWADWFQLSLKEGLIRCQGSIPSLLISIPLAVKRIEDVSIAAANTQLP